MALVKKWEVELDVKYFTWTDIENCDEETAIQQAIDEFYDQANRAEIENWEANSSLYCDECGDEDVEETHICEEETE
jgi:hypothetical protein